MREIEFEYYDKEEKEMLGEADGSIGLIINMGLFYQTLRQFTGLRDKNGKKIFEGDILKTVRQYLDSCNMSGNYKTWITEVSFNTDIGCWDLSYNNFKYKQPFEWLHLKYEPVEVIGNIYENPELLEGVENETTI